MAQARSSIVIKLGVLISGSGSNLQAVIDAIAGGRLDASVELVISSNADAFGLQRAERVGIESAVVSRTTHPVKSECDKEIARLLLEREVDYVVMAGYMRLLGTEVLEAFPSRVINLHPALLPAFKGAHAIEDALEAGVKVTGVTVHYANEVFDEGPIIAQRAVEIFEDDTLDSLALRIHALEHELLPEVLIQLNKDFMMKGSY